MSRSRREWLPRKTVKNLSDRPESLLIPRKTDEKLDCYSHALSGVTMLIRMEPVAAL
jgi:hypothetical protein